MSAVMTDSEDAGDNKLVDNEQAALYDVEQLASFVRRTAGVMLEESTDRAAVGLRSLEAALAVTAHRECMRKFISDQQTHVLLVERVSNKDDEADGQDDDGRELVQYSLSNQVRYVGSRVNSLVLIKHVAVLDAEKPLTSQLQATTLCDGSPYETLHTLVSNAVSPFFKSYVKESGKGDRDGDKMAPTVEKKIAELEMGLLHLQQNIDIPEITLPINPYVAQVVKKCAEEGRRPQVADFGEKLEDSSFLNQLQNGVNRWIREIQKVTRLERDPASGTAIQEVSFWLNLERALLRIQEKRDSFEVALTMDILRHGKRFHATISFDADTGLKQALATVNDYNPLMKDFPLNELLAASELDQLRVALRDVFHHMRKIRNTKYSLGRALRLVEAISRDLMNQLLKILGGRRLMQVSYDDFDALMAQCFDVFVCWDDEYDKLLGLMRDLMKKKHEHVKMAWRVHPAHKRLQARMDQLRKFRCQHEQLRTVIVRVLRPSVSSSAGVGDSNGEVATTNATGAPSENTSVPPVDMADANAIEEVHLAYEQVKDVDCLDISKDGVDVWEAALSRYNERIDRVETRITARLRDQLGTAKNANEMFRIFSRFNALFVRQHIRGAIREYQTQLITRVKEDIESLHEKFKIQYQNTMAYGLSEVRDMPPVSGSILWARQIDNQLSTYVRRVEDVLGCGWENHVEGQKLKADSDSFRMKLNTADIFAEWAKKVQDRNLGVSGLLFAIESQRSRTGKGNILKLKVNFLPEIITLSKEVRNLKNLGFRVPLAIVNKAHTSNQMYPFAISLIESVRTYERTLEKMEDHPHAQVLVAGLKHANHALIAEGVQLIWESYKLDTYVQRFAESALNFQEMVDYLLHVQNEIDMDIKSLDTCTYSHSTFVDILDKIQKAVDDLSLHKYSNLGLWVNRLDDLISAKLADRLQAGVQAWTRALKGVRDETDTSMDTEPVQTPSRPGGEPVITPVLHELRIIYNNLHLYPAVEDVRSQLLHQLFAWQNIIITLVRIQSSRYQVGIGRSEAPATYKSLLQAMPDYKNVTAAAYQAVNDLYEQACAYVDEWLSYQKLWDLNTEQVLSRLEEDITLWISCVEEMKKRRATFDTSETCKSFGPVVIDYGKVQSKVSLKYDAIHKEILGKFGSLLGTQMSKFHSTVSKSRGDMELQSIEAASTSDAVMFITYVQSLKRQMKQWEREVELYKDGQRVLERHRFQFPSNWLHVDNIEGEWGAFNEIIKRKDSSIQTQVASLQMKIVAEDKMVEGRTNDYLNEWEKQKPVEGHLRPLDALQQLQLSEARLQRLKEERDNVSRAKEALELGDVGVSAADERLQVAFEELNDLKGVWSELSRVWERLDELKEKPWLSVQPRKLRQELDALLAQLKELPTRLRQYSSYEYVKKLLQSYTKVNMLIVELKSDALKERHWTQLQRQLRVRWHLSELTLGQVWDVDLLKNETIVKDIILVAQGEMALEEFLKQVRDCWQTYQLELINYQNKCKVIRGWDDLFAKVKEHTNSLAAMKLSPYYKVFEEDAVAWEEKLNRIDATFDVWMTVQRRWVYLEGLFSGSSDIKTLLPVETSRFASISTEFLTLMKKVSRSPMVLDVLNIQGVMRALERLADLLGKIQKALGEYLERERSGFPRFYFVGDEDLLEIIGNSKNIPRLQKHFKKMFAGITAILLNEDSTEIRGVASAEGEEVIFDKAVLLSENPKINEWLSAVERNVCTTLASQLARSLVVLRRWMSEQGTPEEFLSWCDDFPAQLVVLTMQVWWSEEVETALNSDDAVNKVKSIDQNVQDVLNMMADSVLQEQPPMRRLKLEHLVNEFVHKRSVLRNLIKDGVDSPRHFVWLQCMRFYWDAKQSNPLRQLSVHMANARFQYGFEYLGVQERLVQTPLTDRCYLTMTQALHAKLGGSPFGPAGTGKTESVKALGHQLGKFVLVFNCDETFDVQAMGRILLGLCQVGAWGCFDEFNRLEERMLSAVSQQIQTIQEALKMQDETPDKAVSIELVSRQTTVNSQMAIFITMNPGYAGRSNLPDNLKKLFRSLAMNRPNLQMIAQVTLFSQGFRSAEKLANKIVPFFKLCNEQLSTNSHYDFSLRALKSVLNSAGSVKRNRILKIRERMLAQGEPVDEAHIAENLPEQEILIQSVCETMVPKLVAEDIPLLFSLLSDVFPGVEYQRASMTELRRHIKDVCEERHLVIGQSDDVGSGWLEKVLQLYQITQLNHGLMMVGPSGSGKSTAWRVLIKALERLEGVEGVAHVIDPKAISKDALYGVLDPNTREWHDGIFTHTLRKIIDNVRGEIHKRQWIIFDGDVDPEWVENLNSVLDNNKLLTLPNGERLALPPNVRIMFEVQDLKHATPATVSRCGMVWFSEDVLTTEMIFQHYLGRLRNISLEDSEDVRLVGSSRAEKSDKEESVSSALQLQRQVVALLQPHMTSDGLVIRCLEFADKLEHIMDFTRLRALSSLFSMINQSCRNLIQYNAQHPDFNLTPEQLEAYVPKALVNAILWSFSGDGKLKVRDELGNFIRESTTLNLPPSSSSVIDFEVTTEGEWSPWSCRVPKIEVETHMVAAPDVVVPTVDTVRHEALLYTWLADHKPLVLCGPPGSGKTMTLFSAMRALPDLDVVGLNFSSATTPDLLFKTFDHYCEYKKTPNGVVLAPVQLGKWLVVFCDEINLPDIDSYGTQRVISFLRQLVEHGGFYRTSDHVWVSLDRIQFVGACNPPTDPGRKPLSHRFLRHVPVVYVDYPGELSLKQIYGTFVRAMLRLQPSLKPYAEPLTSAMVDFYLLSQQRFTQEMQPHYVYSPREMTRWVRGICEAIKPMEGAAVEALVRLWAHEALRLFQDRLVYDEERQWTNDNIDAVARKHFPNADCTSALKRPILYSNWLHKDYVPVEQQELREYVKARLKVFYEEELDVPLVLFNEVLDHVLRIDRIYRQPQGHLLLIGVSGAGKTTLSRFVAWMNGLSVFQIKVHNKYSGDDFDEDLRMVLRRSGCKAEKMCFILDESNMLDSGFLERMNTLLANGEVPGLFDGDEFSALMTQCKEGSQREGLMLDSNEELYKWFTSQVIRNLHVVFTMNPSTEGLKDRASTSPALFNRCVLNWFGDWSNGAYFQVGREFTNKIDLDRLDWQVPDYFPVAYTDLPQPPTHRDAIVNAFVHVHNSLQSANQRLSKRGQRTMVITPRHYLDMIQHFVKLYSEKRADLEEQQLHLNVGLNKIAETVEQVEEMQKSLAVKSQELQAKNDAANQKLKQMMVDQQEAERQKVQSQEIQVQLEQQTKEIAVKREDVLADLSQVEPAVVDAQAAVKSIKKQNLVELRTMGNPPMLVRLALESICLLLGEETSDWKTIRSVIMKDNFIPSIVNYSTEDITDEIRDKLKKRFLSNPDYSYEKVNKASSACGPMVKWAIAQVNYADMLKRVEPLRNELGSLESQADRNKKKAQDIGELIAKLEKSISSYKEEYAVLIAQAQAIKTDLSHVQSKVDRSMALLKSLSIEQERWMGTSDTFRAQMMTIIGDVLLSAAFLAYSGYLDQQLRQTLFSNWCCHLQQAGVLYRGELARTEYLSSPDQRLRWQANSLPVDDLFTENAIMLQRFNRYPLIIDPSGQATEFIMQEYAGKKITQTSFLDDSFRKNLESALRFGNPLLVQDVENYDPILNPVLNRELRRTGGRVLITLGDQDIDLSPTFTIFLSTRDPTVEFPADICSRVTFVNFTVTRSSLQSQCLNQVLKSERPDIDEKRSDLLKIQGEFRLRLRYLEKSLLQALNDSKGKILDDDSVITTLETLKREAAEITNKVEETDKVIGEIESVSQQYLPLAQACSSIYFTLDSLHQIHFLYQFSLQFFLDVFTSVLTGTSGISDKTDPGERLELITNSLFATSYGRVSRGLLHEDSLTLAMLLARIRLRGLSSQPVDVDAEMNFLIRGNEGVVAARTVNSVTAVGDLTADQVDGLTRLSQHLPSFSSLMQHASSDDFQKWVTSETPERQVPRVWSGGEWPVAEAIYGLLLIQAVRPDRLMTASRQLVAAVLGENFLSDAERQLDLSAVVEHEVRPSAPLLLCAVHGYDASGRVDDVATERGAQMTSIAIGSAEGFSQADRAINAGVKSGRWVLLKNVHLAPSWLVQLEKKLHSLRPHPSFRLFLTMDISAKVPVNLLRAGRIIVFEPPPGIRANLLRTFSAVPASRMMRAPSERARIYFLLAWLHAVVQERVRYAPLGWSKHYEFTESDLRVACDTLDVWIDTTAMGRTNLPPEKVPWTALQTLLAQCVYGGKIDNDFDQRLLSSFLDRLFNAASFDSDFQLVVDSGGADDDSVNVRMPDGIRRDQFLQWAEQLTGRQTPGWLGLPNNAEKLLLIERGRHFLSSLLRMQSLEDDDGETAYGEGEDRRRTSTANDGRPAWMRQLHSSAGSWLQLLPQQLNVLRRTAENIRDPLYRFFEREVNTGGRLLRDIRVDLEDSVRVCEGTKKQTNHHRTMVSELVKGLIPAAWRRYTIPRATTVSQFIMDFAQRVQQLQAVSKCVMDGGSTALRSHQVWLGGLFNPEAYVTATRQCVAQANGWSLEELQLQLVVSEASAALQPGAVGVRGVCLQGATCVDNRLQLTTDIHTELPLLQLSWSRDPPEMSESRPVTLPVYLNASRCDLLFTVTMHMASGQSEHSFYSRGVALLASIGLN